MSDDDVKPGTESISIEDLPEAKEELEEARKRQEEETKDVNGQHACRFVGYEGAYAVYLIENGPHKGERIRR